MHGFQLLEDGGNEHEWFLSTCAVLCPVLVHNLFAIIDIAIGELYCSSTHMLSNLIAGPMIFGNGMVMVGIHHSMPPYA
ncbi:hypothetical protein V6N12_004250 [Hibiscus sabdariffa]